MLHCTSSAQAGAALRSITAEEILHTPPTTICKCFMNYRHLPIICLILATVVVTTYAQNESTNDWHPNTDLLDSAAKRHDPIEKDAGSTLAHDVKHFYQALRDKRWHETYR